MILQPDTPIKFQARNHKPVYRRLQSGDFYGGNMEYERETWDVMQTIPDGAILEIILYYHFGDPTPEQEAIAKEEKPKREKKVKPGTDENGSFWNAMKAANWDAIPGVEEILAFDDDPMAWPDHEKYMAEGLRRKFAVTSRREISPAALEDWAAQSGLEALITVSRGAQAAAARKVKQ